MRVSRSVLARVATLGLAALALGGLVAACGDTSDEATDPAGSATGVPADAEALAAIALEHLAMKPSTYEKAHDAPDGVVAVEIRLGADGEYDGDLVSLWAAGGALPEDLPGCATDDLCAELETDAGTVELRWQPVVPEEDPGGYYVLLVTDDGYEAAFYSGDDIDGDPREQDLSVDVDELVAVITDDRYGVATTRAVADTEVEGFPDDLS